MTLQSSPVHTIKDARNKDHTTAPPNTGIYSINESTNKCTSGVTGRPKCNVLVYNLYCFPAKNGGGNTEVLYYLVFAVRNRAKIKETIVYNRSSEWVILYSRTPNWPKWRTCYYPRSGSRTVHVFVEFRSMRNVCMVYKK